MFHKNTKQKSRPILPQRAKNVMPIDVACECEQAEFAQILNGLRSCEQYETVLWNFCYTARLQLMSSPAMMIPEGRNSTVMCIERASSSACSEKLTLFLSLPRFPKFL